MIDSSMEDALIDVVIIEMDKPSSALPAKLDRGPKFEDLKEGVISRWKENHHECAELYVAVKLWNAIQPKDLLPFDKAVKSKYQCVVAVLVIPRPGHPKFHDCRPLSTDMTEQLIKFLASETSEVPTLPSPTTLFTNENAFIRSVYRTFYDTLKENIRTTKAFIVTGSPGIGKTIFLWYLLLEFRRASKVVVFDCDGFFLLAHPIGVIVRGERRTSFRYYLEDRETIYLCDALRGSEPFWGGGITAKTIVTTSPDPSLVDQFAKNMKPKKLCMPLWSLEELQACREKCYAGIGEATVKALFETFGGTARETIVPDALLKSKQREFQTALNALTSKEIDTNLDFIGLSDVLDTKESSICHRFVHLRPTSDQFDTFTLVPASPLACHGLTERHTDAIAKTLSRLLAGSSDTPEAASTRGILFERWAHNLLAAGGKFNTRRLYAPDPTTNTAKVGKDEILELKATNRALFKEIKDIKPDEYAVPKAKNFPAFDAIRKPSQLFQMTVSNDHKLGHQIVQAALKELGESAPFKLYFVVPDDIFDTFKYQPYVTKTNTLFKKPTVDIDQYALSIDLSKLPIVTQD